MLYFEGAEAVRIRPHGPLGMVDTSRSITNPAVFLFLSLRHMALLEFISYTTLFRSDCLRDHRTGSNDTNIQ